MLFKNNKFYENLVTTEKEKEKMIDECFKILDNESLPSDDKMSLRRNEKMKKKENADLIKKVAVASASIVACGAITLGAINRVNDNNNSSVSAAKQVTTIEETAESVTKKEIKNDVVKKVGINLNKSDYTDFKWLFPYVLESGETVDGSYHDNKEYIIGDYTFKWKKSNKGVYVKGKEDKEYVQLPGTEFEVDIDKGFSDYMYCDGKIAVYSYKDEVYLWNLETKKVSKLEIPDELKDEKMKNPKYTIGKIRKGIVYIDEIQYNEENGNNNHFGYIANVYAYDISSSTFEVVLNGRMTITFTDNYVVTGRFDEDSYLGSKYYIERIDDNGFEEVEEIKGVDVEFPDVEDGKISFRVHLPDKYDAETDCSEYVDSHEKIVFDEKTEKLTRVKVD